MIPESFLKLDDDTERRLRRFADLLARAGDAARLTGPKDAGAIYDELLLDCLSGLELFRGADAVADVGTGGGIPGLALALCLPETHFTLMDSIGKKVRAVASIAAELGADNVEVINARSEDVARGRREAFDAATARAVAAAPVLAEYLSPLVRQGGQVIAYKGRAAQEELAPAAGKWGALGLSEPELAGYARGDKQFCLVVWRKIKKCPPRYPRKPGEAERRAWYEARTRSS